MNMPQPLTQMDADSEEATLKIQALVVTEGPYKGRICENDDDDFARRSDFSKHEIQLYEAAGIQWRRFPYDKRVRGVECEIVTFGGYIDSADTISIPRCFLKPATMKDLVERFEEIGEIVFRHNWGVDNQEEEEIISYLLEKLYVVDEIWRREIVSKTSKIESKLLFLCHSSQDKPFVRQVRNDLANAGHNTWIDEFEIKVGDSIVEKINSATEIADGLIFFLSEASMNSSWVKREWQSTLYRYLSGSKTKVYPALIEECDIPPILSDIKFADFRRSYRDGLAELLKAVA
jgi:TIR domain